MTFQQQEEINRKKQEDQAQEVQDRLTIADFYTRHPEYRESEATTKAILEYMADAPITPENLDAAVQHTRLAQILKPSLQTPAESREAVEQKLLEMYETASPGTSGDRRQRWRFQQTEQLREELANLIESRRMRAMTPAALRAEIAAARPGEVDLPSTISSAQIRLYLGPAELRHLIARYGVAAVNRRLQEKPKRQ
jgi:hypothetical protein